MKLFKHTNQHQVTTLIKTLNGSENLSNQSSLMTLKAIYDLAPVYCTQLQPSCPSCSSPDMPKGFTCFTVLYLSSTPLCSSPWQPQCLLPSFRFLFSITFPDDLNQNINLPYHYLSLSLVYFSFQHLPQPDKKYQSQSSYYQDLLVFSSTYISLWLFLTKILYMS